MKYTISFILALFIALSSNAENLERSTITSCTYQAGTAREIQTIRQTEGDNWSIFEKKIKKIYKEGQGRTDLLAIAKSVYRQPIKKPISEVYAITFDACVKLTKGTAETA